MLRLAWRGEWPKRAQKSSRYPSRRVAAGFGKHPSSVQHWSIRMVHRASTHCIWPQPDSLAYTFHDMWGWSNTCRHKQNEKKTIILHALTARWESRLSPCVCDSLIIYVISEHGQLMHRSIPNPWSIHNGIKDNWCWQDKSATAVNQHEVSCGLCSALLSSPWAIFDGLTRW